MRTAKFSYFFPSHLFTFHSLVQLLLPVVKLNRIDQPILIEYKIVHVSLSMQIQSNGPLIVR